MSLRCFHKVSIVNPWIDGTFHFPATGKIKSILEVKVIKWLKVPIYKVCDYYLEQGNAGMNQQAVLTEYK